MKEYDIEVRISPRRGLLDPQGKAIHSALHSLEFDEVESVRVGRLLRLKLLANPVTEDYEIAIGAGA